jgi:hypothetical protein
MPDGWCLDQWHPKNCSPSQFKIQPPVPLPVVNEVVVSEPRSGVSQHPPMVDRDILSLEETSRILRCTVDTLRRIHRDELPVFRGPGRGNLYLREDVIEFVRSRRIVTVDVDDIFMEELGL